MLIALFINYTKNISKIDAVFSNAITIAFFVFLIVGLAGSHLFFSGKLKKINSLNKDLLIKTAEYRSSLIVRYAFIEGSAFFSIIGFLLTGSNTFIVFVGIPIIILLALRPSKERLINDLQLAATEKGKIYDPNAIISEILLRV